jgi:hypothetical protein
MHKVWLSFCCKNLSIARGERNNNIGNVRYHRKDSVVMIYLQNKHAGNKFCQPEGLVLCHPIRLADYLRRACNSVGFWIRIHLIRIRIQHFRLNTVPDPDPDAIRIRIQMQSGSRVFRPKIGKIFTAEKNFLFLDQKLQFTYH